MQRLDLRLYVERHGRVEVLPALEDAPAAVRRGDDLQVVRRAVGEEGALAARGAQLVAHKGRSVGLDEGLGHVDVAGFAVGEGGRDVDVVGGCGLDEGGPMGGVEGQGVVDVVGEPGAHAGAVGHALGVPGI